MVDVHGNVLAAISFLHGLSAAELTVSELEARVPGYEVTIAVRAVKAKVSNMRLNASEFLLSDFEGRIHLVNQASNARLWSSQLAPIWRDIIRQLESAGVSTGCAATRPSISPASGCPTAGSICARSRPLAAQHGKPTHGFPARAAVRGRNLLARRP